MLEHFRPGGPLAWELAWQSTAALILGGAASLALARRPARAHGVLVLAMLAGLLTPLLGQGARRFGWGLLPAQGGTLAAGRETAAVAESRPMPAPPRREPGPIPRLDHPEAAASEVKAPEEMARAVVAEPTPSWLGAAPWGRVAVGAWLALSASLLARLVLSLVPGRRQIARSTPIGGGAIPSAAEAACRRLGLGVAPRVVASDRIRCPLIWCWASRPILLVPASALDGDGSVDWEAVLTHELAHWKRRDHLANLLGELACGLLPWNPLAWWARARLGGLSELACDDWVIASGQSATDYAESLLGLVPQRRTAFALAAVSGRIGLVDRVRRILDDRRRSPSSGPAWTALAALATALVAAMTALAQPQQAANPSKPKVESDVQEKPTAEVPGPKALRPPLEVKATVFGTEGKPEAGAEVIWLGMPRAEAFGTSLPVDRRERNDPRPKTLARGTTDAEGRFAAKADFSSDEYAASMLIVRAEGAGMTGQVAHFQVPGAPVHFSQPLTFRLRSPKTIEGRLLTPSGGPAAGVRVALEDYGDPSGDELEKQAVSMRYLRDHEEALPDFWPRPLTTDKDGRFRIEGVVPEGMVAKLRIRHPDFADADLMVSTGVEVTAKLRAELGEEPYGPNFTHSLEPARPVEGVVTDEETGKPLAGVIVKMIAFLKGSGTQAETKTDADGRYRVAGKLGDQYWATAFPDPSSGAIPVEKRHEGWPAGAKTLVMDFALPRGRILRGRVVADGTGRPIEGASVVYKPSRGNPYNRGGYEFRSPVLTDPDGRFAITGLAGQGLLGVDGPGMSSDYIRVPVNDPKIDRKASAYPHGFARVEIPAEGDAPETRIALRKGVALDVRAVDPDGKPLERVNAWCAEMLARQLENWETPQPFADGRFRLRGADPDRTYRIFFVHPKRKLGALAEVKYDPSGPVEVRLQPAATAKGVVLDPNGRPIRGAQILPYIVLTAEKRPMRVEDFWDRWTTVYTLLYTQEPLERVYPPEFTYDNLIPGVPYYIGVYGGHWTHHLIPALKPGEVRDLGAITHKPEAPR